MTACASAGLTRSSLWSVPRVPCNALCPCGLIVTRLVEADRKRLDGLCCCVPAFLPRSAMNRSRRTRTPPEAHQRSSARQLPLQATRQALRLQRCHLDVQPCESVCVDSGTDFATDRATAAAGPGHCPPGAWRGQDTTALTSSNVQLQMSPRGEFEYSLIDAQRVGARS